MKQITVSGLDHPLAPYLVVHQLLHGAGDVVCHADHADAAEQMRAKVDAALRQHEEDEAGVTALLARLRFAHDAAGPRRHFRFLGATALAAMFGDEARERQATGAAADAQPEQLLLVFDRHNLPYERSVASCMRTIEQAASMGVHPHTRLHLFCMGACVDDSAPLQHGSRPPASPLETLVSDSVGLMDALRRRAPDYLGRYPLHVRQHGKQEIRVMPASRAAALLAGAGHTLHAPRNVIIGAQAVSIGAVVHEAVKAAGGVLHTAHTGEARSKAAELLDNGMAQTGAHANTEWTDLEAAQGGECALHLVRAPAADLSLLLRAAQQRAAQRAASMQRDFAGLPGMTLHASSRPGLRYYSCGAGDDVVLLVNAFGLPLDFWQMLVSSLGTQYRFIALDRAGPAADAVPTTCYSSPDYVADYLADCSAVLDGEAIGRCHVASWCSGAKLALELARAQPARIQSLTLLAPSFAGIDGFAGDDSAYEKNLFTMCKLVNKTPKTAGIMASTMLQMMEKNSKDIERFNAGRKDAVDVLELADAHHQPALYRPFSSAANLVEFSRQLAHFRQHDIRAALGAAGVRVPVMLVTGRSDTTTSNERARDICGRLREVVGFEVEGASHYLIHQDYRLVGKLLAGFLREGINVKSGGLRIRRTLFRETVAAARESVPEAALS